jgi:hypothetical protein
VQAARQARVTKQAYLFSTGCDVVPQRMTRRRAMKKIAIPALATLLLISATPAFAIHNNDPRDKETIADQQRCTALTAQWNQASTSRAGINTAKDTASQGEVLCRAGKWGEGSETLAKALSQIGVKPN